MSKQALFYTNGKYVSLGRFQTKEIADEALAAANTLKRLGVPFYVIPKEEVVIGGEPRTILECCEELGLARAALYRTAHSHGRTIQEEILLRYERVKNGLPAGLRERKDSHRKKRKNSPTDGPAPA